MLNHLRTPPRRGGRAGHVKRFTRLAVMPRIGPAYPLEPSCPRRYLKHLAPNPCR